MNASKIANTNQFTCSWTKFISWVFHGFMVYLSWFIFMVYLFHGLSFLRFLECDIGAESNRSLQRIA